jgi:hypothetical protein
MPNKGRVTRPRSTRTGNILEALRPSVSPGSAPRSTRWRPVQASNYVTKPQISYCTLLTHNNAISCKIEVPAASAMKITVFVGVMSFSVIIGNEPDKSAVSVIRLIEGEGSSKMSVHTYQTTRRHVQKTANFTK